MNILVLNGSPKAQSDTLRMTRHFLAGICEKTPCEVKQADVIKKDIQPCLGCFGCWQKGDGKCVQQDDQNEILADILWADLIIWSFPLYCYGMPSHLKAVQDRTIPLLRLRMKEQHGKVQHETLYDLSQKHFVVICGAGFPDWEGNFDGIRMQCRNSFGHLTMICVPEAPLLNIPAARPVAEALLERFRLAGQEYAAARALSPETVKGLETPMIPKEDYLRGVNASN